MPFIVTLPDAYPYVALAASSTFLLTSYQVLNVGNKRKLAGIKYPQLYAEKAETATSKAAMVFNCAQRAHQNTLESLPIILFTTMLTGLRFPVASAAMCGAWVVSRVLYTIGYSTGDPSKRNAYGGMIGSAAGAILGLSAIYTSVEMILKT